MQQNATIIIFAFYQLGSKTKSFVQYSYRIIEDLTVTRNKKIIIVQCKMKINLFTSI